MSDTDALFDTSPRAMAARFGLLALSHLRAGRNCREAARLAFGYAALALRNESTYDGRGKLLAWHWKHGEREHV